MIPKIIHYCWFGDTEKPDLIQQCVESYYNFHSDWLIIEWNNDTYKNEFGYNEYVKYCIKNKQWVKIADYVRLEVITKIGGIYLDADVEIIKPLDDLLDNKMFFPYQNKILINHAVCGSVKNNSFINTCVENYSCNFNGNEHTMSSGPFYITKMLQDYYGVKYNKKVKQYDDLTIYPNYYFYPYYVNDNFNINKITPNTYTIHYWTSTWKKIKS